MQVKWSGCTRALFTRVSTCQINIPMRKIMDRYDKGLVNGKRLNHYMQKEKKRQYERDLERAIIKRTNSYQEWMQETKSARQSIYKKYLSEVDEAHPFLVDDYRMAVNKEMKRIDRFYQPLIEREAAILREKRERGLIHIEPEPFYLEGLDEIIPKIHEYLESKDDEEEEEKQIGNKKGSKKLLE